jgi:hypothetical protein
MPAVAVAVQVILTGYKAVQVAQVVTVAVAQEKMMVIPATMEQPIQAVEPVEAMAAPAVQVALEL